MISTRLKQLRTRAKLTIRDVAQATGISDATISRIETGNIKDPAFSKVISLLKFYGIKLIERKTK